MKYHKYSFPPSERIKEFGELIEDSHLVVDGNLLVDDKTTIPCHFEVAYTKDTQILVVIYLSDNWFRDFHEIKQVEGTDRYYNFHISVSKLFVTQKTTCLNTHEIVLTCIGQQFQVGSFDSDVEFYDIVNLRLLQTDDIELKDSNGNIICQIGKKTSKSLHFQHLCYLKMALYVFQGAAIKTANRADKTVLPRKRAL